MSRDPTNDPVADRSTDTPDWKTDFTFFDYRRDSPSFDVITKCPSLQFPRAFLTNLATLHEGVFSSDYERWITPDAQSQQDWIDSPRPCLLKKRDGEKYKVFKDWYDDLPHEDFVHNVNARKLDGWNNATGLSTKELDRILIKYVVEESMKIRKMCGDKELSMFQEEWWRMYTYHIIAFELESAMNDINELKPDLDDLVDLLKTIREDELEIFVWGDKPAFHSRRVPTS